MVVAAMTNQQIHKFDGEYTLNSKGRQAILERAIQKAIDGGWQPSFEAKRYRYTPEFKVREPLHEDANWSASDIIFNHDFAKALWGEDMVPISTVKSVLATELADIRADIPRWKIHLQQMVIADDPIKYLGENL